ncbi:MAG: tetratricopeptide repeat protein [Armatimonadetes bacterium]|nr:tetratricopeptide repeat protein [Armatimonadota bacterium]
MVCPKCFENNDDAAEFCKDCGAPLKEGADASEQDIYTELARANLFRVRGDYKGAHDVCLRILRKYPNNPTAHTLLGDICTDQGDLRQAATWYEMALDLVPDSPAEKQKLNAVQERLRVAEAAEAAKQIGIATTQPKPWPYIALVGVLLLCVGIGAFALGRGPLERKAESTIQTPVNVTPTTGGAPESAGQPPKTDEPPVNPVAEASSADAALLKGLVAAGAEKTTFLSAVQDPRGPCATVTVASVTDEVPNVTAIRAGLEFYKVFAAYTKVTIRVIHESATVLAADLTQQAANTAKAAIEGGDSLESQAQVMLSNVWTPTTAPHAETNKEGSTASEPTRATAGGTGQ